MSKLPLAILAGLLALYPLLVYSGLGRISPGSFGLLLMLLVAGRVILGPRTLQQMIFGLVVLTYCLLVAWFDSPLLLRLYPVVVSFLIGAGFLYSLRAQQPLLERVARLRHEHISSAGLRYIRRLTLVWGLVIVANGLLAAYTACCTSWQVWAFYNGLLSYALMAAFFGAEWLFRQHYRKRVDLQ